MTLIELVVSISVMLLVSTLCFPKDSIEKYQMNSFMKQLCSDIRYVRRINMLGNTNVYIILNKGIEECSYTLRKDGENLKIVFSPKNSRLESNTERLRFRANGTPDTTIGTIRLYSDKVSKEITIVPISGRVLLKEGKYES